MSRKRIHTWLAVFAVAIGLLVTAVLASLITFPERGMAVAVTTNISYADTVSLALRIAEAFAVSRRQ
jgi:hypothetical protein